MDLTQNLKMKILWFGSKKLDGISGLKISPASSSGRTNHHDPLYGLLKLDFNNVTTTIPIDMFTQTKDHNLTEEILDEYDAVILHNIDPLVLPESNASQPILHLVTDSTENTSSSAQDKYTCIDLHQPAKQALQSINLWLKWLGSTNLYQQIAEQQQEIENERDNARLGLEMLGEQLAKMVEHGEQVNYVQERFLSLVSHELRTPLNGIIGMSELLASQSNAPEQSEGIELIHQSSIRLSQLIDNILDYRSLKLSESQDFETEFDLYKCVEEVIEQFQPQAVAADLMLYDLIASDTPQKVRGDIVKLRKILYCLISNAIKYTPQGHVAVSVHCVQSRAEVDLIQIQVQDTGVGISSEFSKELFDSFAQSEDYRTRKHEGMGMGLYIAQQLAQKMGGHIHLQSQLDEGSTFSVCVQVKKAMPPKVHLPSIWKQVQNIKVLVWTLNTELGNVLASQLEQAGCKPILVSDPQSLEALVAKKLSSDKDAADILLIDDQSLKHLNEKWLVDLISRQLIPVANLFPLTAGNNHNSCNTSFNIQWNQQGAYPQQQEQLMHFVSQLHHTTRHTRQTTQHQTRKAEHGANRS